MSLAQLVTGKQGSNIVVAAPMVIGTELAYRMLMRKHGIHLAYTPMLRADYLVSGNWHERRLLLESAGNFYINSTANENAASINSGQKLTTTITGVTDPIKKYLRSRVETTTTTTTTNAGKDNNNSSSNLQDSPLVVQLAGSEPTVLREAVRIIKETLQDKVDAIDFNLGCPQACAKRDTFGAFLDRDRCIVCLKVCGMKSNQSVTFLKQSKIL